MDVEHTYHWLIQSNNRKDMLRNFNQPLTATQIACRTGLTLDACLHLLWGMRLYGILYCLNEETKFNKIYWLTSKGRICQRWLRDTISSPSINHHFPKMNWDTYSSVCYSHRSAVIKAVNGAMQAADIKRRASIQNPDLRMSANNVRDVMRHLRATEVTCKVTIKRKKHPRYELTNLGHAIKELLIEATQTNQ